VIKTGFTLWPTLYYDKDGKYDASDSRHRVALIISRRFEKQLQIRLGIFSSLNAVASCLVASLAPHLLSLTFAYSGGMAWR